VTLCASQVSSYSIYNSFVVDKYMGQGYRCFGGFTGGTPAVCSVNNAALYRKPPTGSLEVS
jgi:hypothetical protein